MLSNFACLVFGSVSSKVNQLAPCTCISVRKEPVGQRVFWCIFEGLVAAVLLLVGGDESLDALQALAVSTGFPFAIILLLMCGSLFIGLNRTRKLQAEAELHKPTCAAADSSSTTQRIDQLEQQFEALKREVN